MTDDRIEKEYSENVRSIEDVSKCLLADFDRWQRFENEIERLETLFREIGSMFDAKMFGERPLEEKQEIVEVMKKIVPAFRKLSHRNIFSARSIGTRRTFSFFVGSSIGQFQSSIDEFQKQRLPESDQSFERTSSSR